MVELLLTEKNTNPTPREVRSSPQAEIKSIWNEATEENGEGSVRGASARRDTGEDRTVTPTPCRAAPPRTAIVGNKSGVNNIDVKISPKL